MNVMLIVIDTLCSDRLGCYGYWRDTSPTIDRLAREGTLFSEYRAAAIATGPAFTTIRTGLRAIHHKFYMTPFDRPNLINFDDAIPTLAEVIQDNTEHTTVAVDNLINFASHMKQFVRFRFFSPLDKRLDIYRGIPYNFYL